jgi:hypothetical protein
VTRLRLSVVLLYLVLAITLGVTPSALAQQQQPPAPASLPQQKANFAWDKTLLRASFSFRQVIAAPAPLAAKLTDGLPHTIAMRAYVWKDGDSTSTDLVGRSCRVVYDLWDEVYRIEITDRTGLRNTAAINADGVARQCAEARDMPIVDRGTLVKDKEYFLAVIVDVDPVDPAMLAQLRAWVTHPTGSTTISQGSAIFGSFTSLFVRNIGTSLQTLQFRTQVFVP